MRLTPPARPGELPAPRHGAGPAKGNQVKLNSWPGNGKRGWGPKDDDTVFGPQLPRTGFWQVTLPLTLIRAYRRIPCKVRGAWSMGSSTSHLAEQAVAAGAGWSAVGRYTSGWKFLPTYAIGAGLRRLGVAALLARTGILAVEMPAPPRPDHGWPLPGMDLAAHQPPGFEWSFRKTALRGEPYTNPWTERSSAGIVYTDIAKSAHWRDSHPNWREFSARTTPRCKLLLDRGRRGWGGDKPRPVWRVSAGGGMWGPTGPLNSAGWGSGDDVWKKVTRVAVIDRGWLASYAVAERSPGWGLPLRPSARSEGWGDPFKHVSLENKELPDWLPTTRAEDGIPGWIAGRMASAPDWYKESRGSLRIGTDWDTPRNAIRYFLLGGLLAGLLTHGRETK